MFVFLSVGRANHVGSRAFHDEVSVTGGLPCLVNHIVHELGRDYLLIINTHSFVILLAASASCT